ncbi:MAG TPA: hypothetical protein P5307_08865, partial [Pirellulaceae bacterium]|nr:hypothetical protein [Pirellulaceae bacterium]
LGNDQAGSARRAGSILDRTYGTVERQEVQLGAAPATREDPLKRSPPVRVGQNGEKNLGNLTRTP